MKKRVILFVSLALVIALAATFFALAEGNALSLLTSANKLLYETSNVSLNAEARFTYDGVWFKTLRGEYKQDGENSYLRMMLDTPKDDGTVYTGGYTVVGNGGTAYSNDTYSGNYYVETPLVPCDTLLRNSDLARSGMAVLRGAAIALSGELDAVIQKTEAERAYQIQLNSVPELINSALTYASLKYIGDHYYFPEDYDYCYSEYEDFDALLAYYYRQLYGEDMPADFMDTVYASDYNDAIWEKYNRIYDALYATCNARVAEYDSGIVWQRTDGSFEWFADQESYLRAANVDYVYYNDYMAAVSAYYLKTTGSPLTEDLLLAVNNTPNQELWDAYIAITAEMEASYAQSAAKNPETVAIYVNNDGSYTELTKLPAAKTLTPTQQILSSLAQLSITGADVKVLEDENGNLASGEGTVTLSVTDEEGQAHALEIQFTAKADHYGDTHVNAFDPAEYGFVTYDEFMQESGVDYTEFDEEAYAQMLSSIPKTVEFAGKTYDTMISLESVG